MAPGPSPAATSPSVSCLIPETFPSFLLVPCCQSKPLFCPTPKSGHLRREADLKHDLYQLGVTRFFFFNFLPTRVFLRWINLGGLVYSVLCLAMIGVNNDHNSSDIFFSFHLDSTVYFLSIKEQTSHQQGWEDAGPTPLVLTTSNSSSSLHPWVRHSRTGLLPAQAPAGRTALTPETVARVLLQRTK